MAVEAQHAGTCPSCGTRYPEGTMITKVAVGTADEGWGHATPCPDPLQVDQPPCSQCFLVHPDGACDLD